jgi:hypothetical protein
MVVAQLFCYRVDANGAFCSYQSQRFGRKNWSRCTKILKPIFADLAYTADWSRWQQGWYRQCSNYLTDLPNRYIDKTKTSQEKDITDWIENRGKTPEKNISPDIINKVITPQATSKEAIIQ